VIEDSLSGGGHGKKRNTANYGGYSHALGGFTFTTGNVDARQAAGSGFHRSSENLPKYVQFNE
jgi:hypothetical protein